ncbi:MAG: AbrB/MazE/SpoVT family DNA-binding domain-containing protein [Gemmatimonadales bacterium]
MVTTVGRWGNSLAIRIPKAFAAQADLVEDTEVEIALEGDTIVVRQARKEWTLDELVKGITKANTHREVEWGRKAGREAW